MASLHPLSAADSGGFSTYAAGARVWSGLACEQCGARSETQRRMKCSRSTATRRASAHTGRRTSWSARAIATAAPARGAHPPDADWSSCDWYERGLALGDADGALDAYRACIAAEPDHLVARNNLATVLQRRGTNDDALAELAEGCARAKRRAGGPRTPPPADDALFGVAEYVTLRTNYGNALKTAGRFADAVPQYEHAIALDPNEAGVYTKFGVA